MTLERQNDPQTEQAFTPNPYPLQKNPRQKEGPQNLPNTGKKGPPETERDGRRKEGKETKPRRGS